MPRYESRLRSTAWMRRPDVSAGDRSPVALAIEDTEVVKDFVFELLSVVSGYFSSLDQLPQEDVLGVLGADSCLLIERNHVLHLRPALRHLASVSFEGLGVIFPYSGGQVLLFVIRFLLVGDILQGLLLYIVLVKGVWHLHLLKRFGLEFQPGVLVRLLLLVLVVVGVELVEEGEIGVGMGGSGRAGCQMIVFHILIIHSTT